ncbi:MAG: uracil-DNA glycosylase [Paenibacillaceae bacterium]|uniref:Uracil-DNA glycosylase n=1 Tax=Paenibacillus mellifer TaxID=2937794 RepID=A0A9X1XUR4_9BACL|nr:uracil-DNA glycosylase [Paenibacillus mellifer]MBW4840787.1 uracil-DNA glycosylase [Paenibacillaceae bacterium]MCK8485940.1 uracil-DNA glycosylase [Paenibacillus mellifer]
MTILQNDWAPFLEPEFEKPYYVQLQQFLANEYRTKTIYPDMYDLFNALHYTSFADTKVVILGQDPYHGPGQAHGFSFSVNPGVKTPPSLQNMFKELRDDLGCHIPNNGYLVPWAKQGVLLLNTVLTVQADTPNSHKDKGWESFTDKVIETLNEKHDPVVFLLWGSHAQKKEALITNREHHLIKSPHPSPLSAHRGFLGSKPFSRANQFLRSKGLAEIDWQIPDL